LQTYPNFANYCKPFTIRIRITDSGNGISEETQVKMMNKYFTSKPAGEGTGIGLSLSREIMIKHNGILFYDKNCKNTSFVLEFPSVEKLNLL